MKIHTKKRSKIILAIVLLVVIGFIAAGYYLWSINRGNKTQEPIEGIESSTPADNRTYQAETEGNNITVPDNVDPSAIKDYELVVEKDTYKIRKLGDEYYITLYAIINRPDQADMYRDQLRQYKQDAQTYLVNQNIDLTKTKIHYEPAEAESL